jgi:glycosyltransferase involved in cell wall biosynthesis
MNLSRDQDAGPVALPPISIVIPNYGYGHTLGRAIESVLHQDYPSLQLIIVDGGSRDQSLDVIHRYESRIDYWVSEPDAGQADAINKGFAHCSGEIVNWLCSDDYLLPGALMAVGSAFASGDCDVVIGKCRQYWAGESPRERLVSCGPDDLGRLPVSNAIAQPSCFYRRALLLDRPQMLRREFEFYMDHELWCHFLQRGARWAFVDRTLSAFEMSADNKTARFGWRQVDELEQILNEYMPGCRRAAAIYRRWYLPIECQIWSIKSDQVRRIVWEVDWKLKALCAYAIGVPELRFILWSWCAPKGK